MDQPSRLSISHSIGPAQPPLLEETIGDCFDRIVALFPDEEALVVRHQDIRWSYSQYKIEVEKLAAGLLALGIEAGDRLGIWAPNCFEWCVAQYATAKIGVILVNINPAYRVFELEYTLNQVGCRAIIAAEQFKTSHYLEMLRTLAPELDHCEPGRLKSARLPALEIVIRMGAEKTPGMFNYPEVRDLGGEAGLEAVRTVQAGLSVQDPINIQFTSGTTGNPKGATLSHYNILNNGNIVGAGMRLTPADRLCIPVPLYHCFGMVLGNLACLCHGATAVFPGDAFEPAAVLETVQEERCTGLHGVPTMFIAELEQADFADWNLSSLRTGIMAGATCPEKVMRQVIERMNMSEVLIAYGQTESSPVNHMTDADDSLERRVGSVGRAGPHLEVKLLDDDGKIVPVGQPGDICVRGYAVMRGYWNDPQKTAETIDQAGWLHSGDIGVMDDEGFVQVVGRIKDIIIRGGENIYPSEIEGFLITHPKILDAQVIGVPDKKYGEQVCAWIRLHDGQAMTEDDVRAHCKENIAYYKVPHYVRIVDEYPLTVTGKVQKFKMKEIMQAELSTGEPG